MVILQRGVGRGADNNAMKVNVKPDFKQMGRQFDNATNRMIAVMGAPLPRLLSAQRVSLGPTALKLPI